METNRCMDAESVAGARKGFGDETRLTIGMYTPLTGIGDAPRLPLVSPDFTGRHPCSDDSPLPLP